RGGGVGGAGGVLRPAGGALRRARRAAGPGSSVGGRPVAGGTGGFERLTGSPDVPPPPTGTGGAGGGNAMTFGRSNPRRRPWPTREVASPAPAAAPATPRGMYPTTTRKPPPSTAAVNVAQPGSI